MFSQWSAAKARKWHEETPWLRGCNYLPADCCNRIAFWQELDFETHLATMDRELALMESIGFNSIRVILEFLVWDRQHDGFMARFERVLECAARHRIVLVVCFGNDCVVPKNAEYKMPQLGIQHYDWGYHGGRRNSPHQNHAGEVGYDPFLDEPESAERFYAMVREIVGRYAGDPRIAMWDLFNEPGHTNRGEVTLRHLKQFFVEARRQETLQPVTSGVWHRPGKWTAAEKYALEVSDVVSFHNYNSFDSTVREIALLRALDRPLMVTEWLNRINRNDVRELFPLFFLEKIGCWNWGFVAGLSQTYEPYNSYFDNPLAPDGLPRDFTKWMHDLFRPSLRPYDPGEIELIKTYCALADRPEHPENSPNATI